MTTHDDTVRRERLVMDTFVELADTLASDYAIEEFVHLLVERCGRVLGADTAGVLLESPEGDLRLAAASSEEMEAIEEAEMSTGQGPCVEAYRTRAAVVAEDLEACRDRWPDVVPRLLEIGMRSGHAFPLQLREDCIGALNLYRRDVLEPDPEDVRLAQALADVAAIGILQERKVTAAERRSAQLQHALDSRIIIEQAKGVLAQRHGIPPQQAYEALRTHARNNRLRVRDVSEQIVAGAVIDVPEAPSG